MREPNSHREMEPEKLDPTVSSDAEISQCQELFIETPHRAVHLITPTTILHWDTMDMLLHEELVDLSPVW